jgi:hypothetical protein
MLKQSLLDIDLRPGLGATSGAGERPVTFVVLTPLDYILGESSEQETQEDKNARAFYGC